MRGLCSRGPAATAPQPALPSPRPASPPPLQRDSRLSSPTCFGSAYASSTLAALSLHEAQHRRLGSAVRGALTNTALLNTEHRLCWMGAISSGSLEQQRHSLVDQLGEIMRARQVRARAERRRELAKHKLHVLQGKLLSYSLVAGRPDARPSLEPDDMAAEIRKLTAKQVAAID